MPRTTRVQSILVNGVMFNQLSLLIAALVGLVLNCWVDCCSKTRKLSVSCCDQLSSSIFSGMRKRRVLPNKVVWLICLLLKSRPVSSFCRNQQGGQQGTGVSGNSRSRPFSGIRASDSRSQNSVMSFSFPFPKVGNAFSIPVPKLWECNFPFLFP